MEGEIAYRKCPKCREMSMKFSGINGRQQTLYTCTNGQCPIGGRSPLGMTEEDIGALFPAKERLQKEAA